MFQIKYIFVVVVFENTTTVKSPQLCFSANCSLCTNHWTFHCLQLNLPVFSLTLQREHSTSHVDLVSVTLDKCVELMKCVVTGWDAVQDVLGFLWVRQTNAVIYMQLIQGPEHCETSTSRSFHRSAALLNPVCRAACRTRRRTHHHQYSTLYLMGVIEVGLLDSVDYHFASNCCMTHTHTHTARPKVAIKNNDRWLCVAMAMERRKESSFSGADQRWRNCSSASPLRTFGWFVFYSSTFCW